VHKPNALYLGWGVQQEEHGHDRQIPQRRAIVIGGSMAGLSLRRSCAQLAGELTFMSVRQLS
jgi:hypothetical protein